LQLAESVHRFFVEVCVKMGMIELLSRGVLGTEFGMLNDELELALEIVPLRGACEVEGGTRLDGVEVAPKTWLLGLEVTVVENRTWLIGEDEDEVVFTVTVVEVVVVVVGIGTAEDKTLELESEDIAKLELVVVVLVVVVVVLVVTSG
jgi:hypothetical protein